MLNTAIVHPTLAVTNLAKAREFYGKTLGLKEEPGETGKGDAVFACGGGTYLYVYERKSPSGSTATACSFEVPDIEDSVKALRAKGIRFEEYNMPEMGLKTVNGIATMGNVKAAWFKDPDGNILAIGNGKQAKARTATPQRA